jgi:hypothetical protein
MRFFEIHFWTPLSMGNGVKSALDSSVQRNASRAGEEGDAPYICSLQNMWGYGGRTQYLNLPR